MAEEATAEIAPGSPSHWENVRLELRDLQQLLGMDAVASTYTYFQDRIVHGAEEDTVGSSYAMEPYRQRVERYIRQHRHHLTIDKLHKNLPVTAADLQELERMLFEEVGAATPEDMAKHFGGEKPFGWLVRNIVGLDAEAARAAFAEFIERGKLSAAQMRFMDLVIGHLVRNGVVDASELNESPFTDLHDQGMFGIFPDDEVVRLIGVIQRVNGNAVA